MGCVLFDWALSAGFWAIRVWVGISRSLSHWDISWSTDDHGSGMVLLIARRHRYLDSWNVCFAWLWSSTKVLPWYFGLLCSCWWWTLNDHGEDIVGIYDGCLLACQYHLSQRCNQMLIRKSQTAWYFGYSSMRKTYTVNIPQNIEQPETNDRCTENAD